MAKDGVAIDFGQIYWYDSPNQHGGYPILMAQCHFITRNAWHTIHSQESGYIPLQTCLVAHPQSDQQENH